MILQKRIFFHVGNQPDWQTGKSITIGDKFTNRYEKLMSKDLRHSIGNEKSIPSFAFFQQMAQYQTTGELPKHFSANQLPDTKSTTLEMANFLGMTMNLMVEFLFDEVRREHFPQKISRFKSIQIIPGEREALGFWLPKLKAPDLKIYRLEVSGKCHENKRDFLTPYTFSFNEIRKNAFEYWSPHNSIEKHTHEWIFQGEVKILEVRYGHKVSTNQKQYAV